ncbi:dTDP-4-dehydrorhamnose 3,5-epimerase [Komagataeibacter rhaeticus]|nr:dTDP-4-dehydrorhamnose 3,5-epimerase [Komagataeibacter rhaeticus]
MLLTPPRFEDDRGYFTETYNAARLKEIGITEPFVQDNHSLSRQRGVVRGLHCQLPHMRRASWCAAHGAAYGTWGWTYAQAPHIRAMGGETLSAENGAQLWIPAGFLHGFCTLTDNAEVQYKCTDFWNRECERSVRWDDPLLAIDWPVAAGRRSYPPRMPRHWLFPAWMTGLPTQPTHERAGSLFLSLKKKTYRDAVIHSGNRRRWPACLRAGRACGCNTGGPPGS